MYSAVVHKPKQKDTGVTAIVSSECAFQLHAEVYIQHCWLVNVF